MMANKRRAILIAVSLLLTFVGLRLYLHSFPGTNFDIGSYNIHHLFTGLLLLTFTGIPLILFNVNNRLMDFIAICFGSGLSMALDEWVYLIVTDGSDGAYLLPVSFWGGVIMVGLVSAFTVGFCFFKR